MFGPDGLDFIEMFLLLHNTAKKRYNKLNKKIILKTSYEKHYPNLSTIDRDSSRVFFKPRIDEY